MMMAVVTPLLSSSWRRPGGRPERMRDGFQAPAPDRRGRRSRARRRCRAPRPRRPARASHRPCGCCCEWGPCSRPPASAAGRLGRCWGIGGGRTRWFAGSRGCRWWGWWEWGWWAGWCCRRRWLGWLGSRSPDRRPTSWMLRAMRPTASRSAGASF